MLWFFTPSKYALSVVSHLSCTSSCAEDVDKVGRDNCTITPTGAFYVKANVRPGILPSILAALMTARATTRAALKTATDKSERAVLDGRQKALKLTANALYGFTGAQVCGSALYRCCYLCRLAYLEAVFSQAGCEVLG